MIDSLLELPPHLRERLASALDTGLLPPAASESAVLAVLGSPEWSQAAARLLATFGSLGITGPAAAAWIRSLNQLEARRPRVYYDPRAVDGEDAPGVLHAKAIIADETRLFVTSANLTEAALGRNIELGLLVRDRALARSAVEHLQGLIERRLLLPLPCA